MNKMAEDDRYSDYLDETIEWAAKPWSASLGAFLKTNRGFWTLWSVHIERVGERQVIHSCIHLTLILSQVHNYEEREEAF